MTMNGNFNSVGLMQRRMTLLTSTALVALLLGSGAVHGQSTWTGAVTNDFNDGGNWDTDPNPPGPGDNAIIDNGALPAPVVGAPSTVGGLVFSANTLTLNSTLNVNGNAAISGTANLIGAGLLNANSFTMTGGTIGAGVTVESLVDYDLQEGTIDGVLSGGVGVSKTGGGTVTLNGVNTYTGNTQVNAGTLLVTGTIVSNTTVANTGTLTSTGTVADVTVDAGGTANLAGASGAITNSGATTVTGLLNVTGTVSNNAGTFDVNGGPATVTGLFTNAAQLNVAAGQTLNADGGLTNTAGTVDNDGTITGVVTVDGGTVNNSATGVLTGATTVNATGTLTSTGTVAGVTVNAGGAANLAGASGAITNSGTTTVTGLLNVTGTVNNNAGTFSVDGGPATVTGLFTNAAQLDIAVGQTLNANGTLTNSAAGTVNNSGTVVGALTNSGIWNARAGSILTGGVTNGGTWNGFGSSSVSGDFANSGTIDLATNAVIGDVVNIGGAYTGGGTIRLDVDLSQNLGGVQSDRVVITGAATGSTTIALNQLNGGPGGIVLPDLVLVSTGGAAGASFTTAPIAKVGLVSYNLVQSGNDFVIRSTFDPNQAGSALSSISSALAAISNGIYQPQSAIVTGPLQAEQDQYNYGVWTRVVGGAVTQSASGTITNGGNLDPISASTSVGFYGVQIGGDLIRSQINGTDWRYNVGFTAGLSHGFASAQGVPGDTIGVDSPSVGAYAAVTDGTVSFDVNGRWDWYDLTINNNNLAATNQKVAGRAGSINASASYRYLVNDTIAITPSAALAYTKTSIDQFSTNGGTGSVKYEDTESVIGRIGVQISSTHFLEEQQLALQPYLALSYWHEFNDRASTTFTQNGNVFSANTNNGGNYFQVGVGAAFVKVDADLTGFGRIDYRKGDSVEGFAVNGGLRKVF